MGSDIQTRGTPGGMKPAPRRRRWNRPILLLVTLGILALPSVPVAAFYVLCNGVYLQGGGFTPRQIYSFTAPDRGSTLVINYRVAFPASELVDPSISVGFELRDARTGRVLKRERVVLLEGGDLQEPRVEWSADAVRISAFDSRQERLVTLRPRR